MADEPIITPPAASVTASPAVEAAPVSAPAVAETPVVAPSSPAPSAAEVAPIVAEPKTAEVAGDKPQEPTVLEPAKADSTVKPDDSKNLLTPKAPEVKVEAVKETEGVKKPEEGAQTDKPAPLPAYDPWVMPEGMTVDKERIGEFDKMLGEFQTLTKADKEATQKFGQSLIDRHISELNSALKYQQVSAFKFWQTQRDGWAEAFSKDPEFGGNRTETSLKAANEFINTFGGKPEDVTSLYQALKETGMSNHPALVKLLARANTALAEPRPLTAQKPETSKQPAYVKRYGGAQ